MMKPWMRYSFICLGAAFVAGGLLGAKNMRTTQDLACIQLYVDGPVAPWMRSAQLDQFFLRFPTYRRMVHSIEDYRSGHLDRCQVSFYIGKSFDNKVPRAFLEDYLDSRKNVIWVGLNIWQLGESLHTELGLRFLGLAKPVSRGVSGQVSYFDKIFYKGQIFPRYVGSYTGRTEELPGQVELVPTDLTKFRYIAEVRHSLTRELIPYIIQSGNRFYVADNPFAQTKEGQGLVVFYDLVDEVMGVPAHLRGNYGIR